MNPFRFIKWIDGGGARRLFGWRPEVVPEEGFRRTVEWYLANCSWLAGITV